MRLSIETVSLRRRYGDFKTIELVKNAGFDAVDMSYYYLPRDSEAVGDNYLDYAKKIKNCLFENGIVCNQAHAPFTGSAELPPYQNIAYGDEFEMTNPRFEKLVRSIEAAAYIGAENIVVHTMTVPGGSQQQFEEYNLGFFKSLERYCEQFGICVAVENLFMADPKRRTFKGKLGTPEQLTGFIKKLDSKWFTACIDVGHAALVGTEPEDFIAGMDNRLLKVLHIQDTEYMLDSHILPYTGLHHWEAIIDALRKIDYKGDMTLEVPGFIQRMPDPLMEDALAFAAKVGRYLISEFER